MSNYNIVLPSNDTNTDTFRFWIMVVYMLSNETCLCHMFSFNTMHRV